MIERDKIHYTFNSIDGYNKAFNYVVASRDVGKSTAADCDKMYKTFKNGRTVLLVNRHIADITTQYFTTIQSEIRKFSDEQFELQYKTSDMKSGIIPLYANEKPFGLSIALSVDIRRLKQLKLPNIGVGIFDEFILNPKYKESYLTNEVEKFKEVYTTFRRDYTGNGQLKFYFMGNAYSKYNPYFIDTGVDLDRIQPGTIVAGDNWAIESYQMRDELYKILKDKNPLYCRDDAYTDYALGGNSVNDAAIRIGKLQNGFKLLAVCEISGRRIGIFRNPDSDSDIRYHCQPVTYDNMNRNVYVFNIEDLLYGYNVLFAPQDTNAFVFFRLAYRKNKVTYSDIVTYYDIKEIYNYI